MESLQALKPLALSLCSICLGDTGVIVCKGKEVSLTSKVDRRNWTQKVDMNILVGFYCPLLRCPIVPLCDFCFFAAIADISFSVINKNHVMMSEVFCQ